MSKSRMSAAADDSRFVHLIGCRQLRPLAAGHMGRGPVDLLALFFFLLEGQSCREDTPPRSCMQQLQPSCSAPRYSELSEGMGNRKASRVSRLVWLGCLLSIGLAEHFPSATNGTGGLLMAGQVGRRGRPQSRQAQQGQGAQVWNANRQPCLCVILLTCGLFSRRAFCFFLLFWAMLFVSRYA